MHGHMLTERINFIMHVCKETLNIQFTIFYVINVYSHLYNRFNDLSIHVKQIFNKDKFVELCNSYC